VTVGEHGQPEIESDCDSECRTILFTHMNQKKDVVHGDCRALFNAVVLQLHPESRQLLVNCFRQLVKHEKTASQAYQPWVTGHNDIFNTLDTVEFTLPPHVRLGFTMTLLESDKRYALQSSRRPLRKSGLTRSAHPLRPHCGEAERPNQNHSHPTSTLDQRGEWPTTSPQPETHPY
jgi:hypothetical protein